MAKIINSHAEVILWNYENRASSANLPEKGVTALSETILLGPYITSITTTKTKSSPKGSFEIQLAPTHNWVTRITPGSWCAILMANDASFETMQAPNALGKPSSKYLKMIGRIDSVRVGFAVDSDGTRQLSYTIYGQDWGSVFESTLYLDPIVISTGMQQVQGQIGVAQTVIYADFIKNLLNNNRPIPTSTQNVKELLKLWGTSGPATPDQNSIASPQGVSDFIGNVKANTGLSLTLSSGVQFVLPQELITYMGGGAKTMYGQINVVSGKLSQKEDKYVEVADSHDFIDPNIVLGQNVLWQLLIDCCNPTLNELIAELRWEGEFPKFTLYKRIRPFLNKPPQQSWGESAKNASMFKFVKRAIIPIEDVISCNAGTNWSDSLNFIEIMPDFDSETIKNIGNEAKPNSQTADLQSFARDGMRAMIKRTRAFIYPDNNEKNSISYIKLTQWKYLLREWFFNTQNLLNGSLVIVGQNQYIGVGDNIMVPASVLGYAPTSSGQTSDSFLLAHVENIAHSFTINEDGTRSFITTINFVRGIITDSAGDPVRPTGIATDLTASEMPESTERQTNTILSPTRKQ